MNTNVSGADLATLKSRLQMTLTLALFFPVTLAAIFKNGDSTYLADQMILKWGMVLVCLVASYIMIEYLADAVRPWIISWVKNLLILEIACLGYIFYIFAAAFSATVQSILMIPTSVVAFSVGVIPFAILLLLGYNFAYPTAVLLVRDVISIWRRRR